MLKTRIEHAQSQVRRRRRRGLSRDWRKFGEKSVALDVVRELDAWTRARLVEGLRAVPV